MIGLITEWKSNAKRPRERTKQRCIDRMQENFKLPNIGNAEECTENWLLQRWASMLLKIVRRRRLILDMLRIAGHNIVKRVRTEFFGFLASSLSAISKKIPNKEHALDVYPPTEGYLEILHVGYPRDADARNSPKRHVVVREKQLRVRSKTEG